MQALFFHTFSGLSVLSLPALTVTVTKALPDRATYASAKGNSLLVFLSGGEVSLFDILTLAELDSFNWYQNPTAKNLPFPRIGGASPDGKLVLLHGGAWTHPVLLWDRRNPTATFSTNQIHLQELQFVDNTHFATWSTPGAEGGDGTIELYDAEHALVKTGSVSVPGDDNKGHVQFQAWSSREWSFDTPFPVLGLVGPAGVVVKGVVTIDDLTLSDRYANLLLTQDSPEFLAADLLHGVLALRGRNELLLFQFRWSTWNGRIRDYCATACREGLLCIGSYPPRLFFNPFDPRQEPARFSLQWPADSKWLPWAMAATPDASTVAVIAQETDSGSTITARYGRIRALLYHPNGLTNAPGAWPIVNAFEVDAPTATAFSARFLVLSPDARTLLYWNSATTVMRYDTQSGKPLGSLELGLVAARSRDGRRVAACSPTGRLRAYDVTSGDRLFDIAGKPASGLCFSTDGSRLVAAQEGMLTAYDLTSGHALSSLRSSLVPLAYPSRGNRFLAFQADVSGAGGSLVLADTSDAHVAAVLNRAGAAFTPAFFSDSGTQLALVRNRVRADVVRSLRPEELAAVLNARPAETAKLQTLAPTNLVTTAAAPLPGATGADSTPFRADDIQGLLPHLGDQVTIQGRVRTVFLVATRTAANIVFDDGDATAVLLWVPWDTYPELVAALGPDLAAALQDRTIRATGRLSKYKARGSNSQEHLEVTLADPAKLVLVAPATAAAK